MGMNGLAAIFCGMLPGVAGIVVMLVTQCSVGTTVYSLQPLAVEELVGSKNLQKALTKTFVFQGVSSIITSFGVGGVVELTGRWSHVFFFIGGFLLTASLLMSTAALIVYRQQRNSGKT
ncbi:hypothetical protein EB796_023879 [Bugula neritina]|uniref:Uncharacterized protein n=1 Tax=Bugula neritina TaxID=10212 RepID=A0A7J7IVJ3_BUGNE|nr:hypothetical protein EB796_023879 [Bugula neritina]